MLSKRYRVLVVDDSAFMRMSLTKMLASEGSLEVIDTVVDIPCASGTYSAVPAAGTLRRQERWNRAGFPKKLAQRESHARARVTRTADLYDSLPTASLAHPAFPSHQAIEYVLADGGELFDPNVAKALVQALPAYFYGTLVELSDGSRGIAVDPNLGSVARPTVRIHYAGGQEVELARPDLSRPERRTVTVKRVPRGWKEEGDQR